MTLPTWVWAFGAIMIAALAPVLAVLNSGVAMTGRSITAALIGAVISGWTAFKSYYSTTAAKDQLITLGKIQ